MDEKSKQDTVAAKEEERGGVITVNTIKTKPFTCIIDVPEVLSASQLIGWIECDAPADLAARSKAFSNAYERLLLVDKFEVNGKAITQDNFVEAIEDASFPAQVIYALMDATDEPIATALNKKK